MSDDPIQQMQALESQNRINEETTLELVAQNQLYNLNNYYTIHAAASEQEDQFFFLLLFF